VCGNRAQGIQRLLRREKWHEPGENRVIMDDNMYVDYEKVTSAEKVLVWRPEVRRPFGIFRYRWDHNIQVNLKGIAL
jgi:hypothetical protein